MIDAGDVDISRFKKSKPTPAKKLANMMRAEKNKAAEQKFRFELRALRIADPRRDFVWHDTRKWELDFAWPNELVGVQIQGASHWLRGKGGRERFTDDCLHRNALTSAGWLVLEFTPNQVRKGIAISHFETFLTNCAPALFAGFSPPTTPERKPKR